MKRFTIQILIIYTLFFGITVAAIVFVEIREQKENRQPRKDLYIINQTNDTISVWITGSYTDAEKKKLEDEPDTYIFQKQEHILPYPYDDGAKRYAARIQMPFKFNTEINFPEDFSIHIQNQRGETKLDRKQFLRLTKGKLSDNAWALYIDESLIPLSNLEHD